VLVGLTVREGRVHRFLALVLLASAAVALAPLARAEGPGTTGTARFLARGPAGLKIEGKTDQLACAPGGDAIKCTLSVGKFTTGIELRDRHLYNAIESGSFPDASLSVARGELSVPAAGAEAGGEAKGQLTFHGHTAPVTFRYSAKRGAGFDVQASFTLDLRDFGVTPPSYMGLTVKPDVEVNATFHLADLP
jgi:YceI-like domain